MEGGKMTDIIGKTAHEVVTKTIKHVIKNGESRDVYGGTIPSKISDINSPNDFSRQMVECTPLTMTLTNPLARWTDISDHWTGITLRETEDSLQGWNPGLVIKYSKLYRRWLKNGYFNYTYGERFRHYVYNPAEVSGKNNGFNSPFDQFMKVVELLRHHPSTRRACISTMHPLVDIGNPYCPCNVLMQLHIIDGKLNWSTVIRSLDVLRGFTENIFMFSIWQEFASWLLGVELGTYTTVALNPHIYKDMIDSGYCNQSSLPDPYKFYKPYPANFESLQLSRLENIDKNLFSSIDPHGSTLAYTLSLGLTPYWRNWKLSLISEWHRLQGNYESAFSVAKSITNEFKFSSIRRLCRNNPDWIDSLPYGKQREYLYE